MSDHSTPGTTPDGPARLLLKALVLIFAVGVLATLMVNACARPPEAFYPTKAAPVVPPSSVTVVPPPLAQPTPPPKPPARPVVPSYFPATKAGPVFRPPTDVQNEEPQSQQAAPQAPTRP